MIAKLIALVSLFNLVALSTSVLGQQSPSQTALNSQEQSQEVELHSHRLYFKNLAESPGLPSPSNRLDLLRYKPILRELEIVDFQSQDLAKIKLLDRQAKEEASRIGSEAMTLRATGNANEESLKTLKTKLEAAKQNFQDKTEDVLLPKQNQRLQEIALELRIQKTGIYNALREPTLSKDLELTSEQLKEMKTKAFHCSREFEQKMLELKQKYRQDVLSVLNVEQNSKLNSMLGERFDWQESAED